MITSDEELIHALYWRIKRKPREGTAGAAICAHSQACGLIAYLFDVDPDLVAEIIRDRPVPGTYWATTEVRR